MSAAQHTPPITEDTAPTKDMHEYVESFGLYWNRPACPAWPAGS